MGKGLEAFSDLASEILAIRVLLIEKGIISHEELKKEVKKIDESVGK